MGGAPTTGERTRESGLGAQRGSSSRGHSASSADEEERTASRTRHGMSRCSGRSVCKIPDDFWPPPEGVCGGIFPFPPAVREIVREIACGIGRTAKCSSGGYTRQVPTTEKGGQHLAHDHATTRGMAWHDTLGRFPVLDSTCLCYCASVADNASEKERASLSGGSPSRGHIRRAPTTEKSGQHLARDHAARGTAWHDTLG